MKNFGLTDAAARRLFPQAASPLPVLDMLRASLAKRGILTRDVLVFALATLAVENPLLNCEREQGPEAYFRERYGDSLGPYDAGFPKWAGRGFSQLTGRYNYELMAKLLGRPEILSSPDCILEPSLSMEVFCEFINHPYYLGHLFDKARVRYNGGYVGFKEFQAAVKLARSLLV